MSNTQDPEIRIGLVEDQLLFRQGIKTILEQWQNLTVTFESPDGYSVMERLEKLEELPEVMLLDLSLPAKNGEEYNGDRVLSELKMQYPEIKVIILSVHEDEYFIAKLIEMGANGYLVKDCDPQEVYEAVVSVYINGSYINQRSLQAIQKRLNGKVKQVKQPVSGDSGGAEMDAVGNTSVNNLSEPHQLGLGELFAELFSNTLKHTNASRIQIELEPDGLRFHYKHNGLFGDSNHAALGLEGLTEKVKALNGEFESSNSPQGGLFSRITLKLNN